MDNTDLPGDESDIDKYLNLEELDKHTVQESSGKSQALATHGPPRQTALSNPGNRGTEMERPSSPFEALQAFTALGITVPPSSSGSPPTENMMSFIGTANANLSEGCGPSLPSAENTNTSQEVQRFSTDASRTPRPSCADVGASFEEIAIQIGVLVTRFRAYCLIQRNIDGVNYREHPSTGARELEREFKILRRRLEDMLESCAQKQKPDGKALQTLRDPMRSLLGTLIVNVKAHPVLLVSYAHEIEQLKREHSEWTRGTPRDIIRSTRAAVRAVLFVVRTLSMGRVSWE